jgi:GNAT superfamily N-acetyltransferase
LPAELRIARVPITHADSIRLIDEVQAEYRIRYGGPDRTPLEPAYFETPAGAFFVGYVDGVPATMGGWRFRPDVSRLGSARAAEVKRMYVAPGARRSGLARLMLAHLEDTARLDGADVMILETGTAQPEAMELYESSGYALVEGFGYYKDEPMNRCYGRVLAATRP